MLRIELRSGLIVLNLLGWILILVITLFPSNVLRIILGIPFLLFFPGYTLLAALFPKKERMSSIDRLALSFGLSIAVVPLIGLILNYTPWGIRLEPILYSVVSFILVTSIIAWLRQRSLTEDERYTIEFQMKPLRWGQGVQDKVLTIILVLVILAGLGAIGYFIATPKGGETFTDFYILGQEGQFVNYPTELKIGDEGRMIVGIANHERREISYRVEVVISSKKSYEIGPVVLVNEEKWEAKVGFVPEVAGENQKVEFFLYKDDEVVPYLGPIYLWVDVRE